MLNTEAFTDRLEKLLVHYDLNATSFADAIGVQRSSISHLLNGRNRPSLDFVMKVVTRFPEVNLYWLLNGKGTFPPAQGTDGDLPEAFTSLPTPADASRQVERIVLFYSDGTFSTYLPGQGERVSDR